MTGRGVTQGRPLSSRIFNLLVDAVIREWLQSQLGAEMANSGICDQIRTLLAAFYTDNGLVRSQDPVFFHRRYFICTVEDSGIEL